MMRQTDSLHIGICAADTAVVEPDVLNNMGLTTLAEVAAAKKKLSKQNYGGNDDDDDVTFEQHVPACIYCLVLQLLLEIYFVYNLNTLRMGDADLHFYITTVQDG